MFSGLITILGIIPPRFILTCKSKVLRGSYKLYILFLILLTTVATVASLHCRYYIYTSVFAPFKLIITDSAQEITMAVCTIISILSPTTFYFSSFKKFLKLAHDDNMCKRSIIDDLMETSSTKHFKLKFLICNLILFYAISFEVYKFQLKFGLTLYTSFINGKFQLYYNFLIIIVIYMFAKSIKQQLKITNKYLKMETKSIKMKSKNTLEMQEILGNPFICSEIRKVSQRFEIHITQILLFNKIFGFQLLFHILLFALALINTLNVSIHFQTVIEVDTNVHLINLIWVLWQLFSCVIVVKICDETEEEARQTGKICIKVLTNLPNTKEHEKLREELFLLDRLNQKTPSFSAAGFFSINYTLLSNVFTSVMTYVIVLIQFKD